MAQEGVKMTSANRFDISIAGDGAANMSFANTCVSYTPPSKNLVAERVKLGGQQDDNGNLYTTAGQVQGAVSFECVYDTDEGKKLYQFFTDTKKKGTEDTVDITVQLKDANATLVSTITFSKFHATSVSIMGANANDTNVAKFTLSGECQSFAIV